MPEQEYVAEFGGIVPKLPAVTGLPVEFMPIKQFTDEGTAIGGSDARPRVIMSLASIPQS